MQLQSLQALSEERVGAPHLRWCCRASDEWHRVLHDGDAADADVDVAAADAALESMLANEPASQDKAMLQAALRHAHVSASSKLDEFPGPMCSPLRKKDAVHLRETAYTVTEKSDGLRVVLVVLWRRRFPAWTAEVPAPPVHVGHLANTFSLERARTAMAGVAAAASVSVSLDGRLFTLQRRSPLDSADDGECFTLADAAGASYALRRSLRGRHFAYAVDRSMAAAYLFLDDHTTPQYNTFVMDAELMCVHRPGAAASAAPRLVLGAFDLFAYTAAADGVQLSLAKRTMMERYAVLLDLLRTCCSPPAELDAGCVRWYAKDMWPVAQVGDCLTRLRYCADSRCFLYDGPHGATENDGLIFTPDDFPISAGTSAVQLKWKWRHLLSIDWLVQASDKAPDLYAVSLFFVKKNYGHRDDVVGHWRLRKPMRLLNPRGFEMPVDTPVVAECAYDQAARQWCITRLRPDKQGANSIITAVSVYESLVEDISLPRLLDLLHVDAADTVRCADALECAALAHTGASTPALAEMGAPAPALDVTEAERCITAKVTLRAIRESRGNTELYLNGYTNQTNKAVKFPLPFPLRKISDCVGLGYGPVCESAARVPSLEQVLYIHLANAGGCYGWSDYVVDAFYDGDTGYWEVVHVNPRGNNKDAIFDNIIEHLDWLLRHRAAAAETAALVQARRDAPLSVVPQTHSAATEQTSEHYGAVARELATAERSGLRRFNNWVKAVLLHDVAERLRRRLKPPAKVHVADVCCGRGGDLLKWQHLHPAFLFMTDASVECVAEAAARYSTAEGQSLKVANGKQKGFPAFFAVHDAFDETSALQTDLKARGPFQLASCQFSMHYGCRSASGIRYFVKAVADALAPHGRFVGTTVSDVELLSRAKEHGAAFGNDVYGVRFSEDAYAQLQAAHFEPETLSFGVPYATTVERSVQDMTEYVVPWRAFVALCTEHHLRLVHDDNFLHFFDQHKATPFGQSMLQEPGHKRGADGQAAGVALSPSEEAAVSLYRLFVFEKVKS